MSVPARCITIGALIFLYWTAAFTATIANHMTHRSGEGIAGWLTPPWLVKPGYFIGRTFLDLLRSTVGHNNFYSPGTPAAWILSVLGAAGMGIGAWLLSSLTVRWWAQLKSPPHPPHAKR